MKETQIQRMNFLKQGSKGMTYKTLLIGIVVWCLFLAMLFGIQFYRTWRIDKRMQEIKAEVASMEKQKDQQVELVKGLSRRRIGHSAKEGLTAIISNRPHWSKMIKGIARSLPPDVWLDSIRVEGGGGEVWYKIVIQGKAKSQRSLTNFILKLESSGLFNRTALDNTKLAGESNGLINYVLSTEPVMKKLIDDA